MAAPSDRNARIALAKGWSMAQVQIGARPDFVGTLEGVAGMLRELGSEWQCGAHNMGFACFRGLNAGPDEFFASPHTRLGDCVGDAWLSEHGKEVKEAKMINFEDWEAEQMRDPEFRAAAEELEPAYQVARLRIIKVAKAAKDAKDANNVKDVNMAKEDK